MENLKEIRAFFRLLHDEYNTAFRQGDRLGIIKTSGELSAAYSMVGNALLAGKWAEEHRSNLRIFNMERKTLD